MTKEQKIAKMQEYREKAESLAQLMNEGVQNGIPNPTMEKPELDESGNPTGNNITVYIADEINECVGMYTALAREVCFEECKSTEDPMLEAIKRLTFTTIGLKKNTKDDTTVFEIVDKDKTIDILRLHKSVKDGIGKDPKWNGKIEKLNMHMTARQAKRLCKKKENLTRVLKEINDSYAMSEIAKQIDMGKDPTSNTKLLGSLQSIVTAMVGEEYKATSHDVNYLVDLYATKGKKALSVNCADHRYFRGYIAAICHGIVTGEDYDVAFKKVNK